MWKEFKRQVTAKPSRNERKTRDGKRPLDSGDFRRMSDEDIEDMDELEKAYGDMVRSANE